MSSFKPIEPLCEEENSGEIWWDGYKTWWGPVLGVTRSQYMVLRTAVELFVAGEITLAAAQLLETAFHQHGWVWADRA